MHHQCIFVKCFDSFRTQTFNIHRLPADKMLNFTNYLGRTCFIIGAVMYRFAFLADQLTATFRTYIRIDNGLGILLALQRIYGYNLGDNLTAFFYQNGIMNMKIKSFNFICIV